MPLFLTLLLLAGCLGTHVDEAEGLRIRAGTFGYCEVGEDGMCAPAGYRFELDFGKRDAFAVSALGNTDAFMDFGTGIFTRPMRFEAAGGGQDAQIEELGPAMFQTDIASRLALATGLLEGAAKNPVVIETEIGTLLLERRPTVTALRIQLMDAAHGIETREAVFSHPDGIWPPQRINWHSDSPSEPFERAYLRIAEPNTEAGWPLPHHISWPASGFSVTRVPPVPEEAGFARDFQAALDAAVLHPAVSAYTRAHPDWLVREGRATQAGIDEIFLMTLKEGCSEIFFKVTFVGTTIPTINQPTEKYSCADSIPGLDELDEFRTASPTDLAKLVGILGYAEMSIAEVVYRAPSKEVLGPPTREGKLTPLGPTWEIVFLEDDDSGVRWEHRISASLPEDQHAFHGVARLPGS